MDTDSRRIDLSFYMIMVSLIFFAGLFPPLIHAMLPGQSHALLKLFLSSWAMPLVFIAVSFFTAYKYNDGQGIFSVLALTAPGRKSFLLSTMGMVVFFFLTGIITGIFTLLLEKSGIDLPEQTAVKLFKQGDPDTLFVLLPASLILAPLGEELAFRHIIYRKLASLMPSRSAAVVSALLFSAVHMNIRSFPALFLLGLFLSFLCRENRSLWNSIAGHIIFNTVTVILLFLIRFHIIPG